MKKKITAVAAVVLVAAIALGTGAAFTRFPVRSRYRVEEVKAKSPDKIRVGIISDCQLPQVEKNLYGWDYTTIMGGASHLIRALKYFKARDVDLIVMNGDVVNSAGDYASYSAYNKILDYVYGEDRAGLPHIVYPMGNHEFYGSNQEYKYVRATGLPLNARTVVNGYSFISISNSRLEKKDYALAEKLGVPADGAYGEKRIAFLKSQLEAAVGEAPEKPVFIFMHMPIDSSLVGGHWATPQRERIYEVLKPYPQAVLFTSHSHYCLSDERSIVQKDFTMINTGSSSYFDFDWIDSENPESKYYGLTTRDLLEGTKDALKNRDYLINPQLLGIYKSEDVPRRDLVDVGFILDVDVAENKFTLTKTNFNDGLPFGEPFVMSEFTKDGFTRSPELLGKGAKPDRKSVV